jgi:mannose-6-phosphate isomerase-like protein (cupin superfamily)
MIQLARFDPQNLQQYHSYGGRYTSWEDIKFDTPYCVAAFSEKRRDDDLSQPWHLWNDEVWHIVEGEIELEWRDPPMFNATNRAAAGPGDVLLLTVGTAFRVHVIGERVRFLWVTMPRPRHFGGDDFFGGGA